MVLTSENIQRLSLKGVYLKLCAVLRRKVPQKEQLLGLLFCFDAALHIWLKGTRSRHCSCTLPYARGEDSHCHALAPKAPSFYGIGHCELSRLGWVLAGGQRPNAQQPCKHMKTILPTCQGCGMMFWQGGLQLISLIQANS